MTDEKLKSLVEGLMPLTKSAEEMSKACRRLVGYLSDNPQDASRANWGAPLKAMRAGRFRKLRNLDSKADTADDTSEKAIDDARRKVARRAAILTAKGDLSDETEAANSANKKLALTIDLRAKKDSLVELDKTGSRDPTRKMPSGKMTSPSPTSRSRTP